jgi:hypothetical protein
MIAKPTKAMLTFCCLLLTSAPAAQDTLLGRHTINLKLKPLPAAEVLNVLSVRSRAVAQLAQPPLDEGRPWTVAGAEQLDGIVVTVDFVETPVPQVIAETLGCIGFTYEEQGDRIVIERASQALPADRCRSVSRVQAAALGSHTEPSPNRKYSWQLASISALDFVHAFSTQSGQSIVWPFQQTGLLRGIQLRVNIVDMTAAEVLQNLFGCIGWKYEQTSSSVAAFNADAEPADECRGFTVLP